jgi:hypothetical protein
VLVDSVVDHLEAVVVAAVAVMEAEVDSEGVFMFFFDDVVIVLSSLGLT